MDKIEKALKKLSDKEQQVVKMILQNIDQGLFSTLETKKFKGHDKVYRVRKGDIRIIFAKDQDESMKILAIERRSDNTYNRF